MQLDTIGFVSLEPVLSFATKMAELLLSFAFSSQNSARPGWAQKPCFPLKGGPVPVQCTGGCSTPPPTSPSPQTGPAEPEPDWLCALGCVILCSRVMSPWLTITAHSVLLFSSEPLNGSLAFNKTAEPAPNSALTPLALAHFLTIVVSA